MAVINWPAGWQDEAVAVVSPLLGSDARVRITVGDPRTSISGSVLEGYLFLAPDGDPVMIYDGHRMYTRGGSLLALCSKWLFGRPANGAGCCTRIRPGRRPAANQPGPPLRLLDCQPADLPLRQRRIPPCSGRRQPTPRASDAAGARTGTRGCRRERRRRSTPGSGTARRSPLPAPATASDGPHTPPGQRRAPSP